MPPMEVTAAQVAEARAALTKAENDFTPDKDVARYIRATSGNIKESVRRLKETYVWRTTTSPEAVSCSACIKDSRAHYMHQVGYDKFNRPVIYSVFNLAKDRGVETNKEHMIHCFEHAVMSMPPGVEAWVWVCDFHGFGVKDCNPAIAKVFIDLTSRYYPERLGAFLLVDTPGVFSGLWKLLNPFLDPVTKEKIRFVPYDVGSKKSKGTALREELDRIFDKDLVDWMVVEMAENRRKDMKKLEKTRSAADLVLHAQNSSALTDTESAPPLGASEVSTGTHTHRLADAAAPAPAHWGTTRMMGTYAANPELRAHLHPAGKLDAS